jgi:hypothetical protein
MPNLRFDWYKYLLLLIALLYLALQPYNDLKSANQDAIFFGSHYPSWIWLAFPFVITAFFYFRAWAYLISPSAKAEESIGQPFWEIREPEDLDSYRIAPYKYTGPFWVWLVAADLNYPETSSGARLKGCYHEEAYYKTAEKGQPLLKSITWEQAVSYLQTKCSVMGPFSRRCATLRVQAPPPRTPEEVVLRMVEMGASPELAQAALLRGMVTDRERAQQAQRARALEGAGR